MQTTKLSEEKLPQKRKNWSAEEDAAFVAIVSSATDRPWADVSYLLSKEQVLQLRTVKQCKERWNNHLDPILSKSKWTSAELLSLFSAHSEIGNKWREIRQFIPHRSENSIKNQFYSCLRKQFRKWKGHEPHLQHIHKYGDKLAGQILLHLRKKEKKEEKTLADICLLYTSPSPRDS